MSHLQQLRTTPPYDEPWKVATLVNRILGGRLNSLGSVTLTQNATTTSLSDTNISQGARLFFTATTADAATVTGLWYDPASVPAQGGQIALHHAAVNAADLDFDYLILK
jgi:hypothetical protein